MQVVKPLIVGCCEIWRKALTDGTDNEGWGALIHIRSRKKAYIGSIKQAAKFCPWCGTKRAAY